MKSLTSVINVQVDAKDKEEATRILKDLGLNMTTFINIAIKQVIKKDGIPFKVSNYKPTKRMVEAMEELEDIENGKKELKDYNNMSDLIKALNED